MNEILLTNATILPMEGAPIAQGYVWVRDGKIAAVGGMDTLPDTASCPVLDARGGYVLPGLVDAHSHLGLYEDGLGFEGADGNEDTDPVTPQMRVIDGVNPLERGFAETRAAGVTAVVVSPGSANPIGGQLAAIKTAGRRIDDMIIRAPLAIKFALGENPKSAYHEREEAPVTRMATAALIREQLAKAQEYDRRKSEADEEGPDFDAKLEALLPLLRGEIPGHFHAHRADDIFTALRIAKEFRIRPVIVHGTEAHLVADLLAQDGVPVISGPGMTDRSKPELINLTESSPGLLHRAGLQVAITVDHPEIPLKFLLDAARIAVRAGMDEDAALRAVTIEPARIAGLDGRIGSIRPGKDGDLALFSGHPFDYKSRVEAVFCEGNCVYRRENV